MELILSYLTYYLAIINAPFGFQLFISTLVLINPSNHKNLIRNILLMIFDIILFILQIPQPIIILITIIKFIIFEILFF